MLSRVCSLAVRRINTGRMSTCPSDVSSDVSSAAARHVRTISVENDRLELQKRVVMGRAREQIQEDTNKLAFLRSRDNVSKQACSDLQDSMFAEHYAAVGDITRLDKQIKTNIERMELLNLLRIDGVA